MCERLVLDVKDDGYCILVLTSGSTPKRPSWPQTSTTPRGGGISPLQESSPLLIAGMLSSERGEVSVRPQMYPQAWAVGAVPLQMNLQRWLAEWIAQSARERPPSDGHTLEPREKKNAESVLYELSHETDLYFILRLIMGWDYIKLVSL